MPRRSTASMTVAPVGGRDRPRLTPPSTLTDPERELWRQVVGALPADYFKREQGELLLRYVRHACRAQALDELLAATDPENDWDAFAKRSRLALEETRVVGALARALRISNQSRLHRTTAGIAAGNSVEAHDEHDDRAAVLALVAANRKAQ